MKILTQKFIPGKTTRARTMGLLVGQAATNASQAMRSASDITSGISIGTAAGSIIPGVGNVIGGAAGAIAGAIGSLFGPAKEGQAAQTWDDMVSHNYLFTTRGIGFDERYFGEALKGAMDKGKNVWGTKCGSDGHQNPDCFYAPLAHTIISGFMAKVVPLTATTDQVYSSIVLPWLQSGAGGQINWGTLQGEPTQQALIKAAVDRYINGLPITRANMPSYTNQAAGYAAWSVPSITVALASLLQPPPVATAPPVVAAAQPAPVAAPVPTATIQPVATQPAPVAVTAPTTAQIAPPSPVVQTTPAILTPIDTTYQPTYAPPNISITAPAATAPLAVTPDNTLMYLALGIGAIFLLTQKKHA